MGVNLLDVPSLIYVSSSSSSDSVKFWKYEDLKILDPWGDSDSNSRDVVAAYVKEGVSVFYFRVDLLDLRDNSSLNIYLAIDYKDGGNMELVKGRAEFASNISWDLLAVLYSSSGYAIFDVDYVNFQTYLNHSRYESQLDYVEFSIMKTALSGRDGKPFEFQVIITDNGSTSVSDRTAVASTVSTTGRAKLVLAFGNMFAGFGPSAISWYDGFAFTPENRKGERSGLKYLLDAVEKYEIPLSTIDARVETLPGLEYLGINDHLRDLSKRGLLDILDTLTYGYFMPWQPKDVDALAISMEREYRAELNLTSSKVFFPYEAMLTSGDLTEIKEAGYSAIYGLDRYGYWFGWITDWGNATAVKEWYESARKIHTINGTKIFFGGQGFAGDTRWDKLGIEPGWHLLSYESFNGTDKGLHHGWRRVLMDMALDPDQEKYISMGTDLTLTPWLFQDVADYNFKWLASHPWIEVVTFSDLLKRNWAPIDHGDLNLSPNAPLEQHPMDGDLHYNAYFWQFYYGGVSDGHSPLIPKGEKIEAYFDYVPYLRGGQHIPSGMKMGDDKTPGTIVYETLRNLRATPNNTLTRLAWLSYFNNIAEQTFHARTLYSGKDTPSDDWGGQYLHPAARVRANNLRQVNKIVAAAQWADEVARGLQPSSTQVLKQDMDLDGEDEYVIKNNKVFTIFENDGGRLEYAFAYDRSVGPVQLVAPTYQLGLWGWVYEDGESPPISGPMAWETAFEEGAYRYSIFNASIDERSLTFKSADSKITKTLTLNGYTVYSNYSTKDLSGVTVGFGLPISMADMHSRNWEEKIVKVNTVGGTGWKSMDGGYAVVNFMGTHIVANYSFTDSTVRTEMKEPANYEGISTGYWIFLPYNVIVVSGNRDFRVSLTLSAKHNAESNVTLSINPSAVKVGKAPIIVSGGITAPSWVNWSRVNVTLEYVKPDGSIISKNVKAKFDGSISDSFTPTATGTWSVKAKWNGTEYVLKSASNSLELTVEPLTFIESLIDTKLIYLMIAMPILAVAAGIFLRSRRRK